MLAFDWHVRDQRSTDADAYKTSDEDGRTREPNRTRNPGRQINDTSTKPNATRYVDKKAAHTILENKRRTTKTKIKFKLAATRRPDTMGTPLTHASPLIITGKWNEAFKPLDHWDVVNKFRALHKRPRNEREDFLRFASPDISHLVWTRDGEVQLLHHFHHDANDGLNDGSDELWALMGGGDGATPMVVYPDRLHGRQLGTETDWSKSSCGILHGRYDNSHHAKLSRVASRHEEQPSRLLEKGGALGQSTPNRSLGKGSKHD